MAGPDIKKLVQEMGAPQGGRLLSRAEAEQHRDRVPRALIEFWVEYGTGTCNGGRSWITDPIHFDPLLEKIFAEDGDYRPRDLAVVERSCFPHLVIWNRERKGLMNLWLHGERATDIEKNAGWIDKNTGQRLSDDVIIERSIAVGARYPAELIDDKGKDIAAAALRRFGPITESEMIYFVPAPQLGGAAVLTSMRKLEMLPQLHILAEASEIWLQQNIFPGVNAPADAERRQTLTRRVGKPS
ncbi:MAG: GAD-like domain-containing protein [Beijerinckiaceae bacterium]